MKPKKTVRTPSPAIERRLLMDRSGQGLTEYLILMILVCLVSIGAVNTMGGTLKKKIQTVEKHIDSDLKIPDYSSNRGD